jgi:ATP-binding cassette subfamily B protein
MAAIDSSSNDDTGGTASPTPRHSVFAGLWAAAWGYRKRTLLALALLVLAKVAAVGVPLLLKAIVDRFSTPGGLAVDAGAAGGPLDAARQMLLMLPVFLLLGYALLRFASTLFTELRDLVFARVMKRTVMAFAERTFGHLLSLSPRFHVQRNTGSLIRDVERGTTGIGFLLGAGLFTIGALAGLVALGVLLIDGVGYRSVWTVITTCLILGSIFFATGLLGEQIAQQRAEMRELRRRIDEIGADRNP